MLANRRIPYLRCHAWCVKGGWPRGRNPFSVRLIFYVSSVSSAKATSSVKSAIAAQGLAAQMISGSEKSCIVYSWFCIFFINIIIIVPFFVVLLNCLYLNPRVLLFVHFPPNPTGRGKST